MRITTIAAESLFGIFDHEIPMRLEDRVTIIHGPNGFGKTTLLKMLDGLFNERYAELRSVPFRRFWVAFEDGGVVWVTKAQRADRMPDIWIVYQEPGAKRARSFSPTSQPPGDARTRRPPLGIIEDLVPGLVRVGSREWLYAPAGEKLSLEGVLSRYGHLLPSRYLEMLSFEQQPDWWVRVRESVEIRFITAQRLLSIREEDSRKARTQMVPAVTEYSDELARIIQEKLAESADISQALDRTFPSRLVQQMGQSDVTGEELREKLSDLEQRRSRFRDAGLLGKREDMEFLPSEEITDAARDVLAVYVQDVEEKLGIFDDIASKIELLTRIINSRFKYKTLTASREKGFSFTTIDGTPLPLTKLSSGEQHQLVLLFQLLFKVEAESLILIDEPELSLHVAWQKQFLKDLEEITSLALLDVLIATHSPQIIHERWDLAVELKGPDAA